MEDCAIISESGFAEKSTENASSLHNGWTRYHIGVEVKRNDMKPDILVSFCQKPVMVPLYLFRHTIFQSFSDHQTGMGIKPRKCRQEKGNNGKRKPLQVKER